VSTATRRPRSRLAIELERSRGGLIALAVLIVMVVVALVVLISGLQVSLPWDNTYTVRVAVDSAKGVVAGKQQVRISGFPVGKITGSELVGGRPVLTLQLDGQYAPLYRNAEVRLRPKTPLDDLYLDVISRGTPSAGALGSGDTLPALRTIAPVDIGQVLDAFDTPTRARLKQLIDGTGTGLNGNNLRAALIALAPFLNAAQRLTSELQVRSAETAQLIHNFRLLTDALNARDTQLHQLVSSGAQTVTQLAAEEQPLGQVIAELPPTLQQLLPAFSTLDTTANQLDPALDQLRPAARAMPSGLAALRTFSVQAQPALTALRKALPSLSALVTALAPTAAGLQRDFSLLTPEAPQLDHVTSAIVPCEFAADKFFSNTLSLTKFADSGGVIVRGQTVNGADPNQSRLGSCAGAATP
jgi:phospholipid/cholesterol/gamma-HCH transport system substrate-binding protein